MRGGTPVVTRGLGHLWGFVAALVLASVCPVSADPPRRIVSVNITSDEILLALVPERLVAVSVLADDADISCVVREARLVPRRVKAETEQIFDLRPDLVVIGGHSAHVASQLERLGVRVIRIQGFESFEWIEGLIRTLGGAVGARPRAEELIGTMRGRLDAVRQRVTGRQRPRVLSYTPGGGTSGRRTTFDDVVRAAGGENVATRLGISGWKRLSLEHVLDADPDVVVMSASQRRAPGFHAELLGHPALREVRALREGRVYRLPGRLMVTSSHHIVETVEALARELHPDAFAQTVR
jgi:iron complex transport system substrate-binding protein